MTEELRVFRRVDFHSVRRLKEVWLDPPASDIVFHKTAMTVFEDSLDTLLSSRENPKGLIFTGDAGSGKTHLLGQIRQKAMHAGAHFVLIDCTDILHFWDNLALQYLQSLRNEFVAPDGSRWTQMDRMLVTLVKETKPPFTLGSENGTDRSLAVKMADEMVSQLRRSYGPARMQRHGAIRALFYLHSEDQELQDLAYSYLQGQDLDPIADVRSIGLAGKNSPMDVAGDLSWLMSHSGPTILAFDQLDPIVTQHRILAAHENHESQAVIQGIVNGLMSLMDRLERTLPIVSILESSFDALSRWGIRSATDRYLPPVTLDVPQRGREMFARLVGQRLDTTYKAEGFRPASPHWPFRTGFFENLDGLKPREVLNRCEQHRQRCIAEGAVTELDIPTDGVEPPPPPPPSLPIDAEFSRLLNGAKVAGKKGEQNEDSLGSLLADICEMFLKELPFDIAVAYQIDADLKGTRQFASLHARLGRQFLQQSDREEHVCVRVLEKQNATAFQNRLSAARTMSGISENLPGRRLVLIRNSSIPRGDVTKQRMNDFFKAGGRIMPVDDKDLALFVTLPQLEALFPDRFETWLKQAKPLSKTKLFQGLVPDWLTQKDSSPTECPMESPALEALRRPAAPAPSSIQTQRDPSQSAPKQTVKPDLPNQASVLLGLRDGLESQPVELPILDLTSHVLIRAGSGGGKTVLLKRLIEQAALTGVSSIVIDSARDLSYLGDAWPDKPEGWLQGDEQRAAQYRRDVKVEIWTPGRSDGRPMSLSPIPDFRKSFDDPNDFNQTIEIATAGLGELLVKGHSRNQPLAVLRSALKYFALQKGHRLSAFADLLKELPDAATPNISKAQKMAREMGDELHALVSNDPLLSPHGQSIDIGELFGLGEEVAKISVISLFALGSQSAQRSFIGRLAMATFEWIRRNPASDGMRGLFVVDEAAPFLPRDSAESKEALMLLAKQARKYGVGLVLATQNPMDLDYNAAAQCSTQFFGIANQPQVIAFIKDAMQAKGMNSLNPGSLKSGQFYLSAPSLNKSVKVHAPMCLSWHPRNRPPTDAEILERVHCGSARRIAIPDFVS